MGIRLSPPYLSIVFTEVLLIGEGCDQHDDTSMHLEGNPPVWSQLLNYFSSTAFLLYSVCVNYIIMLICPHSS